MQKLMKPLAVVALTASLVAGFGIAAKADSMMKSDTMMKDGSHTMMVGGAAMYPTKNIIENASKSKDHTTLVAAIKAAGLVETLEGKGPFTVFAPTNAAFAKLPAGTVDNLLKPENKATLTSILTYHVVAGTMTASDIAQQVKAGGGKVELKTVDGTMLTVRDAGAGKLEVVDAKGDTAMITTADVMQSNGVIHVIDTVMLPQ